MFCLNLCTFVPRFSVLSSPPNVGNSQDSAKMPDKDESGDAVAWRNRDVKTTVAIEETWMRPVKFDAFLVNNEHGDLSSILGGIEDLEIKEIIDKTHHQGWKHNQNIKYNVVLTQK